VNADHVGREVTEQALGQAWTFARWERSVHQEFSTWAQSILPDPLDVVSRNLDKIALKDAAILRQLQIDDLAETKKAAEEKRPAILMARQYKPFADHISELALQRAGLYLGFGSPEVTSLINTAEGSSYLVFLLLKRHHPDVTLDKAFAVMVALGPRLKQILEQVQGKSEEAAEKNEPAQAG
jgi:hypothetical protein